MAAQKASVETSINHMLSNEENPYNVPIEVLGPEDDLNASHMPSALPHSMVSPESTSGVVTSQAGYSVLSRLTTSSAPLLSMIETLPNLASTMAVDTAIVAPSATSITTVLTTVFIAPTPTSPLEVLSPSPTTSMDAEATQSSTSHTKRATILIGLGVGLIIGVLILGGMVGLFLWRRRKNKLNKLNHLDASNGDRNGHSNDTEPDTRRHKGFAKFFRLRQGKGGEDTEWSIESAEKVSIVKNVRAQSVLTRSSSKRSNALSEGGVVPIGIPEDGTRVALTSHPMTPSYTRAASQMLVKMNGKDAGLKGEVKPMTGKIVK